MNLNSIYNMKRSIEGFGNEPCWMPQMLLSVQTSRMEDLEQKIKWERAALPTGAEMKWASPQPRTRAHGEDRCDRNKLRNCALGQYV